MKSKKRKKKKERHSSYTDCTRKWKGCDERERERERKKNKRKKIGVKKAFKSNEAEAKE